MWHCVHFFWTQATHLTAHTASDEGGLFLLVYKFCLIILPLPTFCNRRRVQGKECACHEPPKSEWVTRSFSSSPQQSCNHRPRRHRLGLRAKALPRQQQRAPPRLQPRLAHCCRPPPHAALSPRQYAVQLECLAPSKQRIAITAFKSELL